MNSGANHEHGSALLALLCAVVITGVLVHELATCSTHYAQLASIYKRGSAVREIIRSGISMPRVTKRTCLDSHVYDGDSSARAIVTCGLGEVPFRFEPPGPSFSGRPDYAKLFGSGIPCPTTPLPEIAQTFTSPTAPTRCIISHLTSSTTMLHNIDTESVDLSQQPSTALLATPGELRVTNSLRTDVDLLIVAGGTIRIPSIISGSQTLVRVTLMSAHGDIEVRTVSPNISLLSVGRRLIATPPSARSSGHPLPPTITAGISGLVL